MLRRWLAPGDRARRSTSLAEITRQVLDTLPPRDGKVLTQRFGLDGMRRTRAEIAQDLAVTAERIRQIENSALRKLRHPSRSRSIVGFVIERGLER
jgi:RNA polymerase primary sigma factor